LLLKPRLSYSNRRAIYGIYTVLLPSLISGPDLWDGRTPHNSSAPHPSKGVG